jgi:hypothetical protein
MNDEERPGDEQPESLKDKKAQAFEIRYLNSRNIIPFLITLLAGYTGGTQIEKGVYLKEWASLGYGATTLAGIAAAGYVAHQILERRRARCTDEVFKAFEKKDHAVMNKAKNTNYQTIERYRLRIGTAIAFAAACFLSSSFIAQKGDIRKPYHTKTPEEVSLVSGYCHTCFYESGPSMKADPDKSSGCEGECENITIDTVCDGNRMRSPLTVHYGTEENVIPLLERYLNNNEGGIIELGDRNRDGHSDFRITPFIVSHKGTVKVSITPKESITLLSNAQGRYHLQEKLKPKENP